MISSRTTALIGGVILIATSVPLGLLALVLGSGGEMIAFESTADHIRLAALLSFPALLFATGCALLWSRGTGRNRLALALAMLIPLDAAAIAGTFWLLDRSEGPTLVARP